MRIKEINKTSLQIIKFFIWGIITVTGIIAILSQHWLVWILTLLNDLFLGFILLVWQMIEDYLTHIETQTILLNKIANKICNEKTIDIK